MSRYHRLRLGAGDWMLPSDDGKTMYRLMRYQADGDEEVWDVDRQAWRTLRGWWWRVLDIPMVVLRDHGKTNPDPCSAPWEMVAWPFRTLGDAHEYAEELMVTAAVDP